MQLPQFLYLVILSVTSRIVSRLTRNGKMKKVKRPWQCNQDLKSPTWWWSVWVCFFFLIRENIFTQGSLHLSSPSLIRHLYNLKNVLLVKRRCLQLLTKNYSHLASGLYQFKRITWRDVFLKWGNPSNPQTWATKMHTASERADEETKRKPGQSSGQSTMKNG